MDSREFADDVNFMNIIEESSSISSNSKIKRRRELAKYSPDVGSVKSFYKQQRRHHQSNFIWFSEQITLNSI